MRYKEIYQKEKMIRDAVSECALLLGEGDCSSVIGKNIPVLVLLPLLQAFIRR